MRSIRPRHSSSYWSSSRRAAQPLDVGADDLASPGSVLGDKAGPFEDRDVLLHSCEAHRIWLASSATPSSESIARRTMSRVWSAMRRTCDRNRAGRSASIQPYGCMAILSRDERHDAVEIGWPAMANVLVLGGGFAALRWPSPHGNCSGTSIASPSWIGRTGASSVAPIL